MNMKKYLMTMALAVGAMAFVACDDNANEVIAPEDDAQPALVSVEQIIDGCMDIADEVGNAKMGDPYDLYNAGRTEDALYAVESWYSWHSIDDYSNNILSIRNAYYGTRDGKIAANSLSALMAAVNPDLDREVKDAINAAYEGIQSIPAPFRNHISDPAVKEAMDRCDELNETLGTLKGYIQRTGAVNTDKVLQPILETYVNDVVLPTYAQLVEKNAALYEAAKAFAANPDNDNFKAAADAWLAAREPWETSEAFLFGPVDALGLDPNMDSWPLDQTAIVNILNSGDYDHLVWGDGDDDDAVEAAQTVRGFHTMEFLVFKNGKPRTTTDVAEDGEAANVVWTDTNRAAWGNYMVQVGKLLQQDARQLYDSWTKSYEGGRPYKEIFLSHDIADGEGVEE